MKTSSDIHAELGTMLSAAVEDAKKKIIEDLRSKIEETRKDIAASIKEIDASGKALQRDIEKIEKDKSLTMKDVIISSLKERVNVITEDREKLQSLCDELKDPGEYIKNNLFIGNAFKRGRAVQTVKKEDGNGEGTLKTKEGKTITFKLGSDASWDKIINPSDKLPVKREKDGKIVYVYKDISQNFPKYIKQDIIRFYPDEAQKIGIITEYRIE